ncbi:PVC-type heme-binding CxxCH protein [Rhodohalobacter sulfatireducens]|uniref:C-type cytochrome n=1 Tax=Rhodohalobacter sulfatireducens TaxID=2911366 RepID=A0ABS9KAQ1_9BACT|nr:PVC-type heme-binding CxxCH protein [Rhodohalobacter sulfatireducens]MCG2587902.1 c-type cytochrome [Rhodohalobacter sulfatireducens]
MNNFLKKLTPAAIAAVSLLLPLSFSGCSQQQQPNYNELTDEQKRSAEYALAGLETRNGLETTLFAAEDMLVNPTNMDVDAEGRVWVTEGYNYRSNLNPENPTKEDGDRIVILEDTDGDNKADTSQVFYQGNDINAALGIMVLDNRVFISRSPHIFVFTDTDGDDKADQKEILFSGIEGVQDDHGVHAAMFGPDGKLYFNMGNQGKVIRDAEGNIIEDIFGNEVKTDGNPFRQGLVFRSNLDGTEFEVLGHNFRNNYEVTVDSYGTVWQSDNDDDGNRSVRINYVMEYGNYGYTDERTGAGWRARRTNMPDDIPSRHWYQNSPGVVPNLLQTGAGSPTGIVLYEGDLLPELFHNAMIHADAGPNIIRSYPTQKDGAGFTATIENILEGEQDQWFRPSDVTVASDGSIFVSDWYDPGVGGHRMGDQQRGRIFRIAPEDTPYKVPEFDLSSPEGAVEALKNPNLSLRARAWLKLHDWGMDAEEALIELWESDNPRYRARALWLLSKLESNGTEYVDEALQDDNEDIRIAGFRAARQLKVDIIPYGKQLSDDPSPQVRREVAIALHRNNSPQAAELWAQLAVQHDGNDRWYLEALGIGAATQWDSHFDAWLNEVDGNWNTPGGRDIVWRSRVNTSIPILGEMIKDPETALDEKLRYFRAFDFHTSSQKQDELISILQTDLPNQDQIDLLALNHLSPSALESPIVQEKLEDAMASVRGTQEYLDLVEKFELETQHDELLRLMTTYPDSSLGIRAASLSLQNNGTEVINAVLQGDDPGRKETVIEVLGYAQSSRSLETLREFMMNEDNDPEMRQSAVLAFGSGWGGEQQLFEMVNNDEIPEPLKLAVGQALADSWRGDVQTLGNDLIGETAVENELPPIADLASKVGDSQTGREVFATSCQICHQVNGEGINFGPALTEIGSKLPKEGLYDAIINPNAGINFGYEGYIITMKDGSQTAGIIQSETETELTLLMNGGYTSIINKSEIASREEMEQSLMPENLHAQMTRQELVDLVEYLTTLE